MYMSMITIFCQTQKKNFFVFIAIFFALIQALQSRSGVCKRIYRFFWIIFLDGVMTRKNSSDLSALRFCKFLYLFHIEMNFLFLIFHASWNLLFTMPKQPQGHWIWLWSHSSNRNQKKVHLKLKIKK